MKANINDITPSNPLSSNADKLYGTKSSSFPQKLSMQAMSWMAVVLAAWLVLGGTSTVAAYLGWSVKEVATPERAFLIILCSSIYAARVLFTQFFLIKRNMPWTEAITVGLWIIIIHTTFAVLGGVNGQPLSWLSWFGVGLYVVGSYLNTGSELRRHFWKKNPANKGRLYTEGLFACAMHINYFGDFTLFMGFSLVTGMVWTMVIPMLMAGMFVFVNIPMLDTYLAKRYAGQFEKYATSTKKFIPFIY